MGLSMSLLIYNPLEAMLLLVFCYLFRDDKYHNVKFNFKKYIIHSYMLGFIFLFVQYPMNYFNDSIFFIIYNLSLAFLIMPIVIFLYKRKFMKELTIKPIFVASLYNNMTILLYYMWFNGSFGVLLYGDYSMIGNELVINLSIKIFQFLLLFMIYGVIDYEKINSKICKNSKM